MKIIIRTFMFILAVTIVPFMVLFTKFEVNSCSTREVATSATNAEKERRWDAALPTRRLPVAIDHSALFNICNSTKNTNLVVLSVVTAPANFEKREKIRSTWGSVKRYKEAEIITVFFIGSVIDGSLQESLIREAETHRDIFQDFSYIDTYRNLTSKSLSIFRWNIRYCSNALRIIKVDDDTLVNPFNLISFLTSEKSNILGKLVCAVVSYGRPFRNINSKYYVSVNEFNGTEYPSYCDGYSYMITPNIIEKLLEASTKFTPMPTEDVYLTGVVREYLGLSQFHLTNSFSTWMGPSFKEFLETIVSTESLLFIAHSKSLVHYDVFWKLITESRR